MVSLSAHARTFAEVAACCELIDDWPSRQELGESGLGRDTARRAFAECTVGLLAEHRAAPEAVLRAGQRAGWNESFAYEAIERYASFFAPRRTQVADNRRRRPYDQMAIAFPAAARPVTPLLLGRAVTAGAVAVRALEPTILVRKRPPPKSNHDRQAHLHLGKPNCGATLNSLALVAHCEVSGGARCMVLGTRPLTRHQDLQQSVPAALLSLLGDVDRAAFALRGTAGEAALALAPVVCDLLTGGAPRGKGEANATDLELVAARSLGVLYALHQRDTVVEQRRWPARAVMLRLPTTPLPGAGPRRVAPNGLQAVAAGWSPDPCRLAAEVAEADVVEIEADEATPPRTARRVLDGDDRACQVSALLTGLGASQKVTVVAHRPPDGSRATVWLTLRSADKHHIAAVDVQRRSRRADRSTLSSPFDRWILRGFRRHGAGDLLIKGGAGEQLHAGVTAASTAAFLLFALCHNE